MRRGVGRDGFPCRRQGGFALIALLALAALMSAYLIANALTRTSAELANERERNSMDTLRQAKAALIAYAASEQWQAYKGQVTKQPGGLPCPAASTSGSSPGICSSALSRIGRLPWATIGAEDLRDASGEQLWYAVSSNFRRASGTTVINSDAQGLLTITGTAPASNVVAIVFAPGPAIQDSTLPPGQTQDRSPANINRLASYLEGFTTGANDYIFTTNALPTATLNDRLIVITQADLMAAVEPAVAARIQRDIAPYLQTYFTQWGAFPFPAKFSNPDPGTTGTGTTRPQQLYVGDVTQTSGLLPINPTVSYAWVAGSGSVTQTAGPGWIVGGTPVCVTSGTSWQCNFQASGPSCAGVSCVTGTTLGIQVEGQVSNAGLSVANAQNFLVPAGNVTVDQTVLFSPLATLGLALAATGNGRVLYGATIQYSYNCASGICTPVAVSVTIPMDPANIVVSTLTSASDANAGWFIANEWYRQTYYAVSPGYLPGGGGSCDPSKTTTPFCLTVNNLSPVIYPPPANDKRAILVFAGRALDGSARPSANLGNYLEGQNPTPADFVYEHRQGMPTSINDRVVVVAP